MAATTTNYSMFKPVVNDAVDADLWGGYLNTNFDTIDSNLDLRTRNYAFAGFELSNPLLTDYAEKAQTASSSSGTLTIDLSAGNHFYTTFTENVTTVTINNPAPTGGAMPLILYITQDGTGSRVITWPSAFKWSGGNAVVLTTTAAAVDIITAFTRDGGTTWYASAIGQGFA